MIRRPRHAVPPPTGLLGSNIKIPRAAKTPGSNHALTLEQHYAAARELWLICGATHRLWLLSGDATGTTRPHGPAMRSIRKMRNNLRGRFLVDFPGQHDPYKDIEC